MRPVVPMPPPVAPIAQLVLQINGACPHPWPRAVCPVCAPACGASWSAEAAPEPGDGTASAPDLGGLLAAAALAKPAQLLLAGGELVLRADALQLLAKLRQIAPHVEVQTAGPLLARPGLCAALREAGATHVRVVLFGDTPAGHDYVAQSPGHFQRVLQGIARARQAGLHVGATLPVLRPTFRGLQTLVQKAVPAGITRLHLWAPPGPDRAAHPLLAPLPLVAPHVQAALRLAQTAGLLATVVGIPICLLGTFAALAAQNQTLSPGDTAAKPDATGSYGAVCGACVARPNCLGVAPTRAAAHGWVGFTALTSAAG